MNQWIRWPNESGPAWRWLADAMGMPALLATPPRAFADIALPASRLADVTRFTALLGEERVRQDAETRLRHAPQATAADRLRLRGGDVVGAPDAVLYPRGEDDVLSLLRLCGEDGVAVTPFGAGTGLEAAHSDHAAHVCLDLTGMTRLLALDGVSGLAEFEAGVTGTELETRLAASGLALGEELGGATLGGWIAQGGNCGWLHDLQVATPRGLAGGLAHIMPGSRGTFGVITRATVLVHAQLAIQEQRGYLFPDFAAGLAALREAGRQGIAHGAVTLSDAAATRFARGMSRMDRHAGLRQRLADIYREVRRFDHQAAALAVTFNGSPAEVKSRRKQFDALAARLGAMRCASREAPDPGNALLDRGVTLDRLRLTASWSRLPALYAAVRAALDHAMRARALRQGAHGLVLVQVTHARREGAQLNFCWLFPRSLDDDPGEAQAVRQAALDASRTGGDNTLKLEAARGIQQALDPRGILPPAR